MTPNPHPHNPLRLLMITVFGLGLTIQLLSLLFKGLVDTEQLRNLPLHGAIEMGGAVIGAMVAYLLMRMDTIGEGSSFNHRIAAALLAMACLDGLHALMQGGNTFVWLHSLATLAGGLLFALVWLPAPKPRPAWLRYWTPVATLTALVIGSYSIFVPEHIPPCWTRENSRL